MVSALLRRRVNDDLVLPLYKGELEGVETCDPYAALTPPNLPLERGGVRRDAENARHH